MNLTLWVVACVLSLTTISASENPQVVNVSADRSYIPIGFDDNDRVQVTIVGTFPSTCYKVNSAGAMVDPVKKTINIWQTAYLYDGSCLRMIVPFSQTVNVGLVPDGNYTIVDGPSGRWLGNIPVTRATRPEPDDYLYAPINDAFLIVDASGTKTLTILGEFADRCTQLDDVRVHYYPEVIVVQPIAKRVGARCEPQKVRFSKTLELNPSLSGTHLLHIRSMNGQAVNKLVETTFLE